MQRGVLAMVMGRARGMRLQIEGRSLGQPTEAGCKLEGVSHTVQTFSNIDCERHEQID